MKIFSKLAGIFLLIGLLFIALPAQNHAAPPPNFQTTPIINAGLNGPSGFEFAPDGRIFILERTGKIKIYKNGTLLTEPFADLPSVASGDRGLIGITFDPQFATNKYIYFYYTALDLHNRLVRFNASGDVATDGPVILYETPTPSEQLHVGGSVRFGTDGKMYFAVGDNGYPLNSQNLGNAHGKILRINKDGSIPTDNPFYGVPGALPEIWAYGFRNPWRFQVDSTTGLLFGGDVGDNTWEEVNLIEKGKNYGWPVCEGMCNEPGMTNPVYTYNHDGLSSAVTGGPIYHGTMFPQEYDGKLFFGDYARGFIRTMGINPDGTSSGVSDFDTNAGSVVDLKIAPDGSLYFITYFPGRLYRVSYSTSNFIPVANSSADITKGVEPLTVIFSSAGSFDPDGGPLSFNWDFGDGTSTTSANPTKIYTEKGAYLVEMTVSDGTSSAQAIPISIQVGIPPQLTVGAPIDGAFYNAGETINYTASAIDGVGNDINDAGISTEILFHHDTHIHPFVGPLIGRTGNFTTPNTGEAAANTWFEIIVTATDTNNLSTTKSINIFPRKAAVTIDTQPAGLQFTLDGVPHTGPLTFDSIVNFEREIAAVSPQTVAGTTYQFLSWSDGGSQTHTFTTPTTPITYTATFGALNPFTAEYFSNPTLSGNPVLTRNDATINFDWAGGSPDPTLPADNFSVRWNATQTFPSGTYRFTTTTDDGVRLFIDDTVVIDQWIDQSAIPHTTDVSLTDGPHTIRMEYFEHGGDATANLSWEYLAAPPVEGFAGQYFANTTLSGAPALTRIDPTINFDWGGGTPGAPVPVDNFSARWTKTEPFIASTYRFTVTADDGIRVKLDGTTVLDRWVDQPPTTYTIDLPVTAGNHILLVEYYEKGGGAVANVSWEPVSGPPTASFQGEYFTNKTLSGAPTLTRIDPVINFDWGGGSPDPTIPNDNYSARWTKTQTFSAGTYHFTVMADDGVRVKLDGTTILDQWNDQPPTTYMVDVPITAGNHTVIVEYYENGGGAVAQANWEQTTSQPSGFSAEYFDNKTLSGASLLTRVDQTVDFGWGGGSPDPSIPNDNFSARWTKTESFLPGTYKFTVTADDGIRVKIDGTTILDRFVDQPPTTYVVTIPITAGQHTVVIEYYENGGGADAHVAWEQTTDPPDTGFAAEYFNNQTLSGTPTLTKNEAVVNFDWGLGSPDPSITVNNFSARWTRTQNFLGGTYRFSVRADDGVRLFVDGLLVIDKWIDQSATLHTIDVPLTTGDHTVIMEYYENAVDAVAKLSWILL